MPKRFIALWEGPPDARFNIPERFGVCQVLFRRITGDERVGRGVEGKKMSIMKAILAVVVISSILGITLYLRAAISILRDVRREKRAIKRRNKELQKRDRMASRGG